MGARAQNKAARDNAATAYQNQANELNTISLRGVQERQAAINAVQAAGRKVANDESVAALAAAENGISGNSVDALHSELESQRGMYNDSVAENLRNTIAQLNREKAGVIARTQSRIQSVQPANPFAVGLKLAGAALSSYSQYSSQQPAATGETAGIGARADYTPAAIPMTLTPSAIRIGSSPMPLVAPRPPLNLRING